MRLNGGQYLCDIGFCLLLLFLSLTSLGAPEREHSHRERFSSPIEKSRLAEAKATARLESNPKDVKALTDRGLARLRLGQLEAALADFKQAVALDPTSAEAQAHLAYGLWEHGELEPALAACRLALARDPDHPSAHRYAGRLLLLTGKDPHEAIRHLERAIELNPEEIDIRLDLVMAYRAVGNVTWAWAQLRPLRTAFPASDPRLLYAEGVLSFDLGQLFLATDRFRQALAASPQMVEARSGLSEALVQAQRWEEAVKVLTPLAKEQPQSFKAAYLLAIALHHVQRELEAEREVRRALSLNPRSAEASALLGEVLLAKGHH